MLYMNFRRGAYCESMFAWLHRYMFFSDKRSILTIRCQGRWLDFRGYEVMNDSRKFLITFP
jgi:hypothetical protein